MEGTRTKVLHHRLGVECVVKKVLLLHCCKEAINNSIAQNELDVFFIEVLEKVIVFVAENVAWAIITCAHIKKEIQVHHIIVDVGSLCQRIIDIKVAVVPKLFPIISESIVLAIGEASKVLRKHHIVDSRAKSIQGSHWDVLCNCEDLGVKKFLEQVTFLCQSCTRVV